jgi:hypothetical protein
MIDQAFAEFDALPEISAELSFDDPAYVVHGTVQLLYDDDKPVVLSWKAAGAHRAPIQFQVGNQIFDANGLLVESP